MVIDYGKGLDEIERAAYSLPGLEYPGLVKVAAHSGRVLASANNRCVSVPGVERELVGRSRGRCC